MLDLTKPEPLQSWIFKQVRHFKLKKKIFLYINIYIHKLIIPTDEVRGNDALCVCVYVWNTLIFLTEIL